ncbi:MAG: hypothetical protein DMF78_10025, partial [Acidobacteria bacterium]
MGHRLLSVVAHTGRALLPRAVRRSLAALCLIAAGGPLAAQTRFAAVVGEITDPTGVAVDGARVTARHVATGLERSATSEHGGQFLLQDLPPGTYEITVARSGLTPVVVKGEE